MWVVCGTKLITTNIELQFGERDMNIFVSVAQRDTKQIGNLNPDGARIDVGTKHTSSRGVVSLIVSHNKVLNM